MTVGICFRNDEKACLVCLFDDEVRACLICAESVVDTALNQRHWALCEVIELRSNGLVWTTEVVAISTGGPALMW